MDSGRESSSTNRFTSEDDLHVEKDQTLGLAFGFTAFKVDTKELKLVDFLNNPLFKRYFERRSLASDVELRLLGRFTVDKDFVKLFVQATHIVYTKDYEDLASYFAGVYILATGKSIYLSEYESGINQVTKDSELEYVRMALNKIPYGDPFIDSLTKRVCKRVQRLIGGGCKLYV